MIVMLMMQCVVHETNISKSISLSQLATHAFRYRIYRIALQYFVPPRPTSPTNKIIAASFPQSYVFISPEKVAWQCMSAAHPLCNNTDVQFDEGARCNMTQGIDWHVGAPREPPHASRSTGVAPRGALHGGPSTMAAPRRGCRSFLC